MGGAEDRRRGIFDGEDEGRLVDIVVDGCSWFGCLLADVYLFRMSAEVRKEARAE